MGLNPLRAIIVMTFALATFIHGGVAYWFYAEPKLQTAYEYPYTYDMLETFAGTGIILLAIVMVYIFELAKPVLAVALVVYFAFFGFMLNEALVLHRGWMQVAVGGALVTALAAKLRKDYEYEQQALKTPIRSAQ